MKSSDRIITIGLALFFAALSVFKLGPPGLNADVILNSIMSLQELTLFYWGQNRLLNIAPLILYPLRDPTLNVYGYLLFAALAFHALLVAVSRLLVNACHDAQNAPRIYQLYTILFFLVVLLLEQKTLFDLIIGHYEYSLSYLLLLIAILMTLFYRHPASRIRLVIASLLVFLSIGVNFSSILPLLALSMGHIVVQKSITRVPLVLIISGLLSFWAWLVISEHYPQPPFSYSGINLDHAVYHLARSMESIATAFRPGGLILLCAISAMAGVLARNNLNGKGWHAAVIAIAFCTAWIVFFSLNTWVQANAYHSRYFTPVILCLIVIAGILVTCALVHIRQRASAILSLAAISYICIVMLAMPVPLGSYNIMASASTISKKLPARECRVYAGNYWLAWPLVLADLTKGRCALAIVQRGAANRDRVIEKLGEQIEDSHHYEIFCIREAVATCLDQLDDYDERPRITKFSELDSNVTLITINPERPNDE